VAIDQIGQGSLSRAVVMIDLAENIAILGGLNPRQCPKLGEKRNGPLDLETLRPFIPNSQNHSHLRRIMTFFDELSLDRLLRQLNAETRRSRRRLLLDLLEVHGRQPDPKCSCSSMVWLKRKKAVLVGFFQEI